MLYKKNSSLLIKKLLSVKRTVWIRQQEAEVKLTTKFQWVDTTKNPKYTIIDQKTKKLKIGNTPVYGSGGIRTDVDTFSYNKPNVLIPRKGKSTKLFYLESPVWNIETVYYTAINTDKLIHKLLYY